MSKLLFTQSKDKGDFIMQPFKGSGKGGQKRNKTMSACRIIHPKSGAVSECQEERSFVQNRKKAFKRLLETKEYKGWQEKEIARHLGKFASIEDDVEREMKNIKIEKYENEKWVEVKIE